MNPYGGTTIYDPYAGIQSDYLKAGIAPSVGGAGGYSGAPTTGSMPDDKTAFQKYGGAGIQVAGSLLSAYLQAKAQEEMNRKKQMVDAAQGEQAMTTNAMRSMGGAFGSALR